MGCFSREYYIGHPVDDDDEFRNTMDDILGDDDPERLHDYLNVFKNKYHYPAFLDMCLSLRAKECARHIIEGKLRHGPPSLRCDHIEPKPDVPVLYQLTLFMCEPRVFDLVLDTCKAANQVNYPYVGLLPLHWLLDRLTELPPLSNWSLRRSLSKLIASLFLPKIRPFLECARKLAQHTNSLDKVALGYILNGEIIPLAALLLVVPFTKGEFETLKSYTSFKDIASLAIHGQSFSTATCYAAALLYLFEKDGDKLTSKLNNAPQEGYVQGVRSLVTLSFRKLYYCISFLGRNFPKSSEINEMIGGAIVRGADAELSFRRYKDFLSSLWWNFGYHDTFWWLEVNLYYIKKVLVRTQGGLPALISPISTFCNDANHGLKPNNLLEINKVRLCLLHVALSSLVKYKCLSKWSPGQSLVKLILLLFLQPKLKPILECAQLLAKHSSYLVHHFGWILIHLGQPIQLAGLLLVAHKNAVEPSPLDETIMKTVFSKVCCGESIAATAGAAGLCEIFDKAGKALAEYWSTHKDEHEPVEVIVEVAEIIQSSGIQVLSSDVDLTDIDSTRFRPGMLKSICKRLGIEIGKTSGLSRRSIEPPFPSVESVIQECRLAVPIYLDHGDDPAMRVQPFGIQVLSKDVELMNTSSHPEMLKSKYEKPGVIVEVAAIIQRSGIKVLSTDVDLTDIYSTSHPEMLKSICERLGIKIFDEASGLLENSRKSPFPSAESVRRSFTVNVKFPTLDLNWLAKVEISSERPGLLGLHELLASEAWKN